MRRLIDCLIAAGAIGADVPVLHRDDDFDVLAPASHRTGYSSGDGHPAAERRSQDDRRPVYRTFEPAAFLCRCREGLP